MQFMGRRRFAVLATSAAILIPVFWHRHLEATDLGSHTYNSWLAELIAAGKAPGLHTVPQWSNVLFDYLLLVMTRTFGSMAGEKIAVALCVLLFFWGGFALMSAVCGHASWQLLPLLAMLSYGWVFNMGFANLYISVGLSFFVLAIAWNGKSGDYFLMLALMALMPRAHILGTAWILFALPFVLIARRISRRWYPLMVAVPLAAFFAVRQHILDHYRLLPKKADVYWLGGADQLVLFGPRYRTLAVLLLVFCTFCFAISAMRNWRIVMERSSVPLSLFGIMFVTVYFTPGGGVNLPGLGAMGLLPDRASIFTAAMGCCILAGLRLEKWQIGVLCVFAFVFFFFLYDDTGKISAAETRVEQLVEQLPPNQRVIGTLYMQGTRVDMNHIIDRACIGHCFSYANYEPSSHQFRIRADEYSPIVTSDESVSYKMQVGAYLVSATDLPLYQIYFCGERQADICMQPLRNGMFNYEFRTTPPPVWR